MFIEREDTKAGHYAITVPHHLLFDDHKEHLLKANQSEIHVNYYIYSEDAAQYFFQYIGQTLHGLRTAQKLTSAHMATQLGIDEKLLLDIEHGKKWVTPLFLQLISQTLGHKYQHIFHPCIPNSYLLLKDHFDTIIKHPIAPSYHH